MTRALLLGAGPSLERFGGRVSDFDVVIGVNRAATLFPLDWWVFGDLPGLRRFFPKVLRLPERLFVKHDWPIREVERERCDSAWLQAQERRFWQEGMALTEQRFSASGPAALALAALLDGAPHVDVECWGIDMVGPGVGPGAGANHPWAKERSTWNAIADFIRDHGGTVTRGGSETEWPS